MPGRPSAASGGRPAPSAKLDAVRRRVGSPYHEYGNVLLYRMDCRELMGMLAPGTIDLTITSPPYNIGKEYERVLDSQDYLAWCEKWMAQIFGLTAPAGAFWLNLGYFELPGIGKAVPIPYLLWNRTRFYLMQEIVWHYGAGVSARKYFSPRNEKYLWYVKDRSAYTFNLDAVRDANVRYPNQRKNGRLRCNPGGKNPTNVWDIPKVTSGKNRSSRERADHPAQFPLAVVDRIVKSCSNAGDLLLDPFIGSGSVAVSGMLNGRQVVGCDLNSRYLDIAIERLRGSEPPV